MFIEYTEHPAASYYMAGLFSFSLKKERANDLNQSRHDGGASILEAGPTELYTTAHSPCIRK